MITQLFLNSSIPYTFIQTFGGVSLSQVSNAQFTEAIVESVSETLKLPVEAVRGISVVENRRMMLSSVTVSYTLQIISGMTSDYFVNELQTSITNGKFLAILSTKSTIQISGVYDLRFMDYSPTANPTSSPVQSLGKSGKDGASINGILFDCLLYFIKLISMVLSHVLLL